MRHQSHFSVLFSSQDLQSQIPPDSAMLKTMKQHPHPFHWAAFTLVGNARQPR